jgi:hypothetical protein
MIFDETTHPDGVLKLSFDQPTGPTYGCFLITANTCDPYHEEQTLDIALALTHDEALWLITALAQLLRLHPPGPSDDPANMHATTDEAS